MLSIRLICVGKMKERFYTEAVEEYARRLTPFCRFEIMEIPEARLPLSPSEAEVEKALGREAKAIGKGLRGETCVIALCIEGGQVGSRQLAERLSGWMAAGKPRICFVIGGSLGLHESVKNRADMLLSMSKMTFPHHLARVMLTEQIYRAFMILKGSKYHK